MPGPELSPYEGMHLSFMHGPVSGASIVAFSDYLVANNKLKDRRLYLLILDSCYASHFTLKVLDFVTDRRNMHLFRSDRRTVLTRPSPRTSARLASSSTTPPRP